MNQPPTYHRAPRNLTGDPATDSNITPCCGRLVSQLPPRDVITWDDRKVTCAVGGWH